MDMWLLTQDESGQLTPDGYTNIDTFSTPDGFESLSPADDPFSKYSEDPPALIACVIHPHSIFGIIETLLQCVGGHWKRENYGKVESLPNPFRRL